MATVSETQVSRRGEAERIQYKSACERIRWAGLLSHSPLLFTFLWRVWAWVLGSFGFSYFAAIQLGLGLVSWCRGVGMELRWISVRMFNIVVMLAMIVFWHCEDKSFLAAF